MDLRKSESAGWIIQGEIVVPSADSFFWYFWGDQPFDIRAVRRAAGMRKTVYAADTDLTNRCRAFERNMRQLERIANEHDFAKLLDQAGRESVCMEQLG